MPMLDFWPILQFLVISFCGFCNLSFSLLPHICKVLFHLTPFLNFLFLLGFDLVSLCL